MTFYQFWGFGRNISMEDTIDPFDLSSPVHGILCILSRDLLSHSLRLSFRYDQFLLDSSSLLPILYDISSLLDTIPSFNTSQYVFDCTILLVDYHLDKVETNNTFRGMISSIKIHQILIVSIPNSIENPRNPCFTRFFYTIYCRKYTILLVCRLLYMTFH